MMVDNEKINSYQDALLNSFGIVAKQIVSELQYDKTILCQVIDDSKKSQGQYTVSDGNTKFVAYSESAEYRKDENVYVTIPNGDFNNEKFITGRKISNTANIYNYKEPFDQIVDLTGNLNPFKDAIGELIANDERIESLVAEINLEENSNIVNYTWLGIKADFKSMIKNAMYGSYGLRIELITINNAVEPIIFDSSKFFGNPYNFITFTTQQQLFNIKGKDKIKHINIYFYQTNNFILSNGNKIVYEDGQKLSNLFVNNIYICAGNDASEISEDVIEVYSLNGNSYNDTDAKKELNLALRWIYKEQDKIINIYSVNDIPQGYNIKWYRYSYDSNEAVEFAGLFWTKIDNDDQLTYKLSTDLTLKEEKIQVIITRTTLNNEIIYRKSQILVLPNETRPNAENDFMDFSNSLRIVTNDDSDGYYYLYSESGPLISPNEASKERYLIPQFKKDDGTYETITELNEGDKISWQFPIYNSMMHLYSQNNDNEYIVDPDQISKELSPMYKISNQYIQAYSNNQVVCTLVKNGKNYQTTKNFAFAPKYNLSSGYTMKITKKDSNRNYFLVGDESENNQIGWEVCDEFGKTVSITGREFNISLVNDTLNQIFVQGQVTYNSITTTNNTINLKAFTNDDLNQVYIIKIVDTVSKLTQYFPVILVTNQYSISGPNEVIYLQDGKINYSQDVYKLQNNGNEVENTIYTLIPENKGWILRENKLLPSNVYIQNINYAIKISVENNVVAIYPILNIQNTSASTSINSVETSQINMGEEEKQIENVVFSAVSALNNNTYSGLIIGTYNGKQGIFGFDPSSGKLILEISANTGRIKIDGKELYVDGTTLKIR